ncbi:hypothetical protein GOP47_0003521 [Adiantum capillus-veneris]|uniref:Uncharacterized protein n=1 Tax=Adiantum capillus-veneris TaxID=13818 RepID=A0A9D4VDZ2_ADICA|nr:hypothetical protein GOP47_0003521 [Adiantum capillus-veneris]
MEGAGPGRARIFDLIPADGLASGVYNDAVSTLSQSLAKYNFAIIQLPPGDDVLVNCVLNSTRMFFHHRAMPTSESGEDGRIEWNRSSGYYYEPHNAREVYNFRPGHIPETENYPPVGLPELFSLLGKASRLLLDAICRSLDLRSFCFADVLDNVPLKPGEVSSSVLSSCCYSRPEVYGHFTGAPNADSDHISLYDHDIHTEKGLLTLVKSNKPGLQVRDEHGRWIYVDKDLGPCDMVLYTGLALYQCTAGYISPALRRYCINASTQDRCSVSFKLMPRPETVLHCSAMITAGHAVTGPFQQPMSVCDFMQRAFQLDKASISRPAYSTYVYQPSDGILNMAIKPKRQLSTMKPLAPSKRLRIEAQRVLKERVQEIADNKGIKIRFCNLKDCEEQHISSEESPCASIRAEIGWPAGVPFVHPHDLPNKSKQAFLEAYEPGWANSEAGEKCSGQ